MRETLLKLSVSRCQRRWFIKQVSHQDICSVNRCSRSEQGSASFDLQWLKFGERFHMLCLGYSRTAICEISQFPLVKCLWCDIPMCRLFKNPLTFTNLWKCLVHAMSSKSKVAPKSTSVISLVHCDELCLRVLSRRRPAVTAIFFALSQPRARSISAEESGCHRESTCSIAR